MLIQEHFSSVRELGSYVSDRFGIARLLQQFPDRVALEAPRDHTINLSVGGCFEVERYRGRKLDHRISRPDCVTVIPAGHSTAWRAPGLVDVLQVYLDDRALGAFVESEFDVSAQAMNVFDVIEHDDPFLRGLAPVLFHEIRDVGPADSLLLDSFFHVLAHHFVRGFTNLGSTRAVRFGEHRALSDREAVRRASEYILANLDQSLAFDDIARHTGVPAMRLRGMFKAQIGMTPYQFVLHQRIAKAQHYLVHTKQPLSEIAYACGFSSQSHLTSMFKKRLGIPPGQYRRSASVCTSLP